MASLTNKVLTGSISYFTKNFVTGQVEGLNNIDFSGPKIVVANHSSYYDHFVILQLLKSKFPNQKVYFLTKQEAFDRSLSRWWHTNLNCIPVDRTGDATKAMTILKRKLKKENAIVVIYPEGTRTPTGKMYYGKPGAETLSYLTKVPIVPIGLHGTYDVLPKLKLKPNLDIRVDVNIGPKIIIKGKKTKRELENIADQDIEKIANLAKEELSPLRTGEYDVKNELLNMIVENNIKGLRNYPDSLHSSSIYHKRVIYMGSILKHQYILTKDEKTINYLEIARAYGRLAYNFGLQTIKGKKLLNKAHDAINVAYRLSPNNAEVLYVRGHYFHFINEDKLYKNEMEKVVKNSQCIKYLVALAKSEILTNDYETAKKSLKKIVSMEPQNHTDLRRVFEAKALLMRIDRNYDGGING